MLGGSAQQVVAIEKAKALGYRTVLCDYLPDNPGQYHADVFYQTSTTDREAVLEVARKEQVEGVLAYASDPAAPTAAYVAERLNLPTNPLRAVEVMSVKHEFRKHMSQVGLPCPCAVSFSGDASPAEVAALIEGLRRPFVIKPTDSSGSKGVSFLEDEGGIPAALDHAREYSRNNILIAEEFIRRAYPNVIGGDIFVMDGEVRFWGLMECLRDPGADLVPCGERTPTCLSERQLANVKDVLQGIVTSLGVVVGELNVEVLMGEDDVPYVLELGARAGGNMIPLELSDASGIDLVEANVLCAMGEEPASLSFDGGGACLATYVLHSLEDGTFDSVEYSDAIAPHVYHVAMYVQPGDPVEFFDGSGKALGIVFLKFDTQDELVMFTDNMDRHVHVRLRED